MTKAKVTTAVVAPAAAATTQSKPAMLCITGPIHPTLHKVTALARLGYLATHLEVYPATGHMTVNLEIGTPDPALVEAVNTDMAEALAREAYQREQEIQAAAVRIVEERERAARKAAQDVRIAEAEAALARLKAGAA